MKSFIQLLEDEKLHELKQCTTDDGKSGWKFGNGPCYLDKEDARKMMVAAIASGDYVPKTNEVSVSSDGDVLAHKKKIEL